MAVAVIAVGLSSCTPTLTPTTFPTASASSSPTVRSAPALIAIVRDAAFPTRHTYSLISADGVEVATDPNSDAVDVGYGRDGLYLLAPGGRLGLLEADGKVHPEGTIAADWQSLAGLAESPDGTRWAYAVVTYATSGPDIVATTRIYVGSGGGPSRLVGMFTRANIADRHFLGGYSVQRWDRNGILLGSHPTGVGGNGPFIDERYGLSVVVRLDPSSGRLSPPLVIDCRFGDIAADGTIACVSGTSVKVVRVDGSATTITTDGAVVGHLAFMGSSSTLAYAVARYTDQAQTGWADTLYVARLGDGPRSAATTTKVATFAHPFAEDPFAWNCVVDGTTIAGLTSQEGGSTRQVVLIRLDGSVTALGAADGLIGVVRG
jgi:hypothetical protein